MIYTFKCSDCGSTWEKEMKMSEYKFPKWCEVCGQPKQKLLRRVYDVIAVSYKGNDFTKSIKGERENEHST